jgi:macrolide-specific efflux system membrane fusion protein
MTGTVVSLTAQQGQTLNATQTAPIILRIADLATMTVWTQVSEADVPRLKPGMGPYFTTLGDQSQKWHGKLLQIQPTPDVVNNVVLYPALFDVANPDGKLMTQMSAQVFFVVAAVKNAVTVPVAALHRPAAMPPKATRSRHGGSGRGRDRR